jgi:hypothetical protein
MATALMHIDVDSRKEEEGKEVKGGEGKVIEKEWREKKGERVGM